MKNIESKYIFVTGGVASSLGKGIISASLAKLLQSCGLSVTILKLDPYVNIDPDTLNPYEHGECYVTDDGAVTDLDLGHYERFLNIITSQANNITTGRIYQSVIEKERRGKYLGKTVQVVPHITDEIKRNIKQLGDTGKYDAVITEIGGTVGDIESLPFIEAVRQMRWEQGKCCLCVHLTYVPYLSAANELKTKPTQHSVKQLQELGVQADILILRTERELNDDICQKVALFCNVERDAVIPCPDAPTIYQVPVMMKEKKLDEIVFRKLNMSGLSPSNLSEWNSFLKKINNPATTIKIGLIGKYVELPDAYKSILEAFVHGGAINDCKVRLKLFQSENITSDNVATVLKDMQGIIVAPGFGERGVEGKIVAIRYVRENNIPFLGICLGMQCAVVEFARNVLYLHNAHSAEIDPQTPHKVIDLMENQKNICNMGGTMRLGAYQCEIKENTLAYEIYRQKRIRERHRHRYEFNNDYLATFEKHGMNASGINPESDLVEIIEIPSHPFFIATQFHPELQSTVHKPHPLFVSFVRAIKNISKLTVKTP